MRNGFPGKLTQVIARVLFCPNFSNSGLLHNAQVKEKQCIFQLRSYTSQNISGNGHEIILICRNAVLHLTRTRIYGKTMTAQII